VTTDQKRQRSGATHHPGHLGCVVCGRQNHRGLNISFCRCSNGWIEARLTADQSLQGYSGLMHGGVISLLLDAAMTHCLFSHGLTGVTARMEIKFRHPVAVGGQVQLRAKLVRSSSPAYHLEAELLQDRKIRATAVGLFVDRPEILDCREDECLRPQHE